MESFRFSTTPYKKNVWGMFVLTTEDLKDRKNKNMKTINVEIKTEKERDELIKQLQKLEFKKELLKSWEELNGVQGFYVSNESNVFDFKGKPLERNKNVFKTKKQAESALAKAQLSQLIAVYNNGWKPDWTNSSETKYTIERSENAIAKDWWRVSYKFLTFKTPQIRDEFLKNFEPLIKTYFEL